MTAFTIAPEEMKIEAKDGALSLYRFGSRLAEHYFRAVEAAGCAHQPEVVGTQRKSIDMGCVHWVNTILGNLAST